MFWGDGGVNVVQSHMFAYAHYTLPPPSPPPQKTEIVSDVCHRLSVAQLDCDLNMFILCNLVTLILVLTLGGQGKFSFHGIIYFTGSHRVAYHVA